MPELKVQEQPELGIPDMTSLTVLAPQPLDDLPVEVAPLACGSLQEDVEGEAAEIAPEPRVCRHGETVLWSAEELGREQTAGGELAAGDQPAQFAGDPQVPQLPSHGIEQY